MNTATFCFIFLTCAAICFSTPMLECRCLRLNQNVKLCHIADIEVLEPRPYCNKKEIIVWLKDGGSRCLDPKSDFTKTRLEPFIKKLIRPKCVNAM